MQYQHCAAVFRCCHCQTSLQCCCAAWLVSQTCSVELSTCTLPMGFGVHCCLPVLHKLTAYAVLVANVCIADVCYTRPHHIISGGIATANGQSVSHTPGQSPRSRSPAATKLLRVASPPVADHQPPSGTVTTLTSSQMMQPNHSNRDSTVDALGSSHVAPNTPSVTAHDNDCALPNASYYNACRDQHRSKTLPPRRPLSEPRNNAMAADLNNSATTKPTPDGVTHNVNGVRLNASNIGLMHGATGAASTQAPAASSAAQPGMTHTCSTHLQCADTCKAQQPHRSRAVMGDVSTSGSSSASASSGGSASPPAAEVAVPLQHAPAQGPVLLPGGAARYKLSPVPGHSGTFMLGSQPGMQIRQNEDIKTLLYGETGNILRSVDGAVMHLTLEGGLADALGHAYGCTPNGQLYPIATFATGQHIDGPGGNPLLIVPDTRGLICSDGGTLLDCYGNSWGLNAAGTGFIILGTGEDLLGPDGRSLEISSGGSSLMSSDGKPLYCSDGRPMTVHSSKSSANSLFTLAVNSLPSQITSAAAHVRPAVLDQHLPPTPQCPTLLGLDGLPLVHPHSELPLCLGSNGHTVVTPFGAPITAAAQVLAESASSVLTVTKSDGAGVIMYGGFPLKSARGDVIQV